MWLEGGKYLIATSGVEHVGYALNKKLWLYDHATHTATDITSPSYKAFYDGDQAGGSAPACGNADRDHRKIWWLLGRDAAAPSLYYSTFDNPGNIRLMPTVDNPAFRPTSGPEIDAGFKGMCYWNNFLWIPLKTTTPMEDNFTSHAYQTAFWRIPVF